MKHENAPWGVQEGDRVRLVAPMVDDPFPIAVGDEGIVTWINRVSAHSIGAWPNNEFWQMSVEWISGRSLILTVPPDKFEIVRPDTCKWCKQDIWPTGRDEDGAEWMNAEGEVVCLPEFSAPNDAHAPMTIDDEVIENLEATQ